MKYININASYPDNDGVKMRSGRKGKRIVIDRYKEEEAERILRTTPKNLTVEELEDVWDQMD